MSLTLARTTAVLANWRLVSCSLPLQCATAEFRDNINVIVNYSNGLVARCAVCFTPTLTHTMHVCIRYHAL